MGKYVLKRIGLMIFTFLIITTICFVLIKMLPLPAVKAMGRDVKLILARREAMGYNKPILVQYALYWKHLLHGDMGLGEQMYAGLEITDVFFTKLPYTVIVNLYSILAAIPLGILFGIYAALRKNQWQDHLVSTLVMLFISVPSYVWAFLVQYLLCYKTGWFSLTVASRETTEFFSWAMFTSMFPAIVSLGIYTIAGLTRFTRAELSEVLTGDYLLLARTTALRAFLRMRACGRTRTMAVRALLRARHLQHRLLAEGRFLKSQLEVIAQVCTALRLRTGTSSAAAATAEEHVKDIVHAAGTAEAAKTAEVLEAATAAAAHAVEGIHAQLVVAGTFLRVFQHIVGFVDFLELRFGAFRVIRIEVRMIFAGQTLIGFLDSLVVGTPVDAQDLIIIAFLAHVAPSS